MPGFPSDGQKSGSFSDFLALPIEQVKQHFKNLQSADLSMALAGVPETKRREWLELAFREEPTLVMITMEEAAWNAGDADPKTIQEAQDRIIRTVFGDHGGQPYSGQAG